MSRSHREKVLAMLKVELDRDPALAVEALRTVTDFIESGVRAAQKELNQKARYALELCIGEIACQSKGRGIVLSHAFKVYAPDGLHDGECQAVKKAWRYAKKGGRG